MRIFLKVVSLLFLSLSFQCLHASAISVEPMIADLNYENRFQDIMVHNVGSDTAYVELQIYRLDNPGLPTQKFVTLEDNPLQLGLIATPSKLIVPAGQTRIVRALYLGPPPTSDIVYQVVIKPVTGQLVALASPSSKVTTGVQMIIAYGVTLYMRPINLDYTITAVRKGTALTLTNKGNTTVVVGECQQCTDKDQKKCSIISNLGKTFYPGNTWDFTLPTDAPLTCREEVKQYEYYPLTIQ